jgi:site-specific DNA recombinase
MRKPNTKKPTRFASYLRCSTDDQSFGDFTTIDTQRAINAEHIEQLGGELVAEYNDEGRTGTNLSRKEWKRMLADAGTKRFDAVVVTYMSRLARGQAYYVAEYLLGESKVSVEMVKEKFSPDMIGQMHKQMTIMMDGNYPLQVSRWTKTKQAEMVRMGYHTGGNCPYGYMTETVPGMQATVLASGKVKPAPKRLIPHPDEAHHVRRAFEIFAHGRSISDAQKHLRAVDPTRRWPSTLVRYLLTNEKYRGVQRFGEQVNFAAHEAIISEQLWDATQLLLSAPERQIDPVAEGRVRGREKDPVAYWLRGLVFCSCGSRMTPAEATGRGGRVPYYECIQAAKNGKACETKRVNANSLHAAVIGEIVQCSMHPSRLIRMWEDAAKKIPQPTEAREELGRVRRNLRETQKKSARVVEAIKQAGALPALVSEVRQLEELAASQTARISELENSQVCRTMSRPDAAKIAAVWTDLLDLWEDMTNEERTRLLRLVVHRIEVQKGSGVTWLCLAAHQMTPLDPANSQELDGMFTYRDRRSAADASLLNNITTGFALLASFHSIPPFRRRSGNDNQNALVKHLRFGLAKNTPALSLAAQQESTDHRTVLRQHNTQ